MVSAHVPAEWAFQGGGRAVERLDLRAAKLRIRAQSRLLPVKGERAPLGAARRAHVCSASPRPRPLAI